jgi:hypothetical protein
MATPLARSQTVFARSPHLQATGLHGLNIGIFLLFQTEPHGPQDRTLIRRNRLSRHPYMRTALQQSQAPHHGNAAAALHTHHWPSRPQRQIFQFWGPGYEAVSRLAYILFQTTQGMTARYTIEELDYIWTILKGYYRLLFYDLQGGGQINSSLWAFFEFRAFVQAFQNFRRDFIRAHLNLIIHDPYPPTQKILETWEAHIRLLEDFRRRLEFNFP